MEPVEYTERRETVKAVQWLGKWDEAAQFARLFREVQGFTVFDDDLTVLRRGGADVILRRGAFVTLTGDASFLSALAVVDAAEFRKGWTKK